MFVFDINVNESFIAYTFITWLVVWIPELDFGYVRLSNTLFLSKISSNNQLLIKP